MYPLFETIRYKNGVAENLDLHQQRVDDTLMQLHANTFINLSNLIASHTHKPSLDNQVYKCRLQYNLIGNVHIAFEPYTIKNIQSISLHDMGDFEYPYKYVDRTWIKDIAAKAGTDEVIFTQKGYIKDASYANLVFFDGANWVTPAQPLLMGTHRAALLKAGIIKEAPLQIKDVTNFKSLKLINAMMLWEESPMITVDLLKSSL